MDTHSGSTKSCISDKLACRSAFIWSSPWFVSSMSPCSNCSNSPLKATSNGWREKHLFSWVTMFRGSLLNVIGGLLLSWCTFGPHNGWVLLLSLVLIFLTFQCQVFCYRKVSCIYRWSLWCGNGQYKVGKVFVEMSSSWSRWDRGTPPVHSWSLWPFGACVITDFCSQVHHMLLYIFSMFSSGFTFMA